MKPAIVFFGNERLATGVSTTAPTLQALINAGYRVAAVVSHYEMTKSRNARDLEIAAVAEQHNIPVLLPEKPSDIADQLADFKSEIGVLVAYGKIVPESVINIFPRGIVNIHPSLLPLHRGPIPLESVILEGADKTGVSIMALVKAMDAGPIYNQTIVPLTGSETKQELANILLDHGKNMLIEALPGILDGSLPPRPQDDALATYDQRLSKDNSWLDFNKSAERLEREIRAFAQWPKSRTMLRSKDGEKEVIITEAYAVPSDFGDPGDIDIIEEAGCLRIQCMHGCIVVNRLKPAGKQDMTALDFLKGYRPFLEK